jgi:hypothetical protein
MLCHLPDLHRLPEDLKLRLTTAVRSVDLDNLPRLEIANQQINKDHGLEL